MKRIWMIGMLVFLSLGMISCERMGKSYSLQTTSERETEEAAFRAEVVDGGQAPAGDDVEDDAIAERNVNQRIYVYVCGAVNVPGIYEFPEGSRVFEAIQAAGGLREDADARCINQADWLADGMQIIVYTTDEVGNRIDSDRGNSSPGVQGNGKININTATLEELITLSGIGETKAKDIIAYREANGAFSDIQEITNVSGIGEKSFEKIKEFITV